jgi:predicted nucleic-acid-binding protein
MSAAVDTNVLVRMLHQETAAPRQCAAARRLLAETEAAGETLFVPLCALLETEWVLRSRYKVDRTAMVSAVVAMFEAPGIEFAHQATKPQSKRRCGGISCIRRPTSPTACLQRGQRIWAGHVF